MLDYADITEIIKTVYMYDSTYYDHAPGAASVLHEEGITSEMLAEMDREYRRIEEHPCNFPERRIAAVIIELLKLEKSDAK